MRRYTDGSWSYAKDFSAVVVCKGNELKVVADLGKSDLAEAEANGHLLGAAKDIFDAAEYMLECIKTTRGFYASNEAPYDENTVAGLIISEVLAEEKMELALSKAKGNLGNLKGGK